MKLLHLSDLHLGKKVNEFSLIEDQQYIIVQILKIIDTEMPDAVIVAGDIYDRSVPSVEAVKIFDDFLVSLMGRNVKVFVISGNHDSAERVAFGSRIMDSKGIYLSPVYDGNVKPIILTDVFGDVAIYLLPFIKPSNVRAFFGEEDINSYTDAVRVAIENMNIDTNRRNVIVTHQFVTGAVTSESEEISVGGTDNVDANVFDCFDYVALGHIHGPQFITRDTVRYCGTPLKYSFSEEGHKKSVTIVELKNKGNVTVRTVDLTPLRDMRTVKGTYEEVTAREFCEKGNPEDYIRVILTDEEDVFDALGKLRNFYKNLMKLEYCNTRTKSEQAAIDASDVENKGEADLFAEFYEQRTNKSLSNEQLTYLTKLIEEIKDEEDM
ncbi:MAG: exonuclease SbcCD subunit D [Lachnospiraceae bacterium]|nr:exonuclease SbcCD subunit D [Lachnospiraceae bacterium]